MSDEERESCSECGTYLGHGPRQGETTCDHCGAFLVWDKYDGWLAEYEEAPAENLPGNWGAFGGDE